MKPKRSNKELLEATRASVKREMAKPRMAKSARVMQRNLATVRIPKQTNASFGKTVAKIIPSRNRKRREKT